MTEKQTLIKEIENYLSDLENLKDCGFFRNTEIGDFTFYHKKMNLDDFIGKGRGLIALLWQTLAREDAPAEFFIKNHNDVNELTNEKK